MELFPFSAETDTPFKTPDLHPACRQPQTGHPGLSAESRRAATETSPYSAVPYDLVSAARWETGKIPYVITVTHSFSGTTRSRR